MPSPGLPRQLCAPRAELGSPPEPDTIRAMQDPAILTINQFQLRWHARQLGSCISGPSASL